jgi:hypothetical protein
MNERIEHLMYLSGLTAQGCWDKLDDYDRTAIEKFAELIVKECTDVIEICSHSNCYSGHEFSFAKESIKKHFGVEK